MVVAACALLLASGRADFTENEIATEVERLRAGLRSRVGFTEAQRSEALEAWAPARALLEDEVPGSTFAIWLEPLQPVGVSAGRLWVLAPEAVRSWVERRYRGLIDEAIAAGGADLTVGFMGGGPQ